MPGQAVETDVRPSHVATKTDGCPLCHGTHIEHLFQVARQGKLWRLGHCLDCGLHFTDPHPTLEDIKHFYTGNYHGEQREEGGTERKFGPKYERYLQWLGTFVPSGSTLDVGCSTGLFPHMFLKKGYDAEGLELNPESAEWGAAHYGIPIHCRTIEDHAHTSAKAYDLITMTDVLEHTVNPQETLGVVHRLLNPGGHLLVTFPDIQAPKSRYYQLLAKVFRRDWLWITCHVPHHTWEFTEPMARNCFQKAGFTVVGFRRTEPRFRLSGKFGILSLPADLCDLGPFASRFGTQMEFIMRKNG